jgi:hypothetical protein
MDPKNCKCEVYKDLGEEGPIYMPSLDANRLIRLNINDIFSIREVVESDGNFMYAPVNVDNEDCLEEVADSNYSEELYPLVEKARYRQVTLKAVTEECRVTLKQTNTDTAVTETRDWNVVIWPTRQPAKEGELIELDTWPLDKTINFAALTDFTIRLDEKANEDGYKWIAPT